MIIIYLQVMGMPSCGQEVNAMVAVDFDVNGFKQFVIAADAYAATNPL